MTLITPRLAVPEAGFQRLVFEGEFLRSFGGESIVSRTEVEDQLVHVASLDINIIRELYREGFPLGRGWIVEGESDFLFKATSTADAISVVQIVVLEESQEIVVIHPYHAEDDRLQADGVEIDCGVTHFRDDDPFFRPTDLGKEVGQVEGESLFLFEGVPVSILDARTHLQFQVFKRSA